MLNSLPYIVIDGMQTECVNYAKVIAHLQDNMLAQVVSSYSLFLEINRMELLPAILQTVSFFVYLLLDCETKVKFLERQGPMLTFVKSSISDVFITFPYR